jgi:two-component system LytT family sensor kinase
VTQRFQWIAATLFWVFIATLLSLQIWFLSQYPGESIELRRAVVWQTTFYLLWIPFTVPIWRVIARWHVDHPRWGRVVLIHLAAAVVIGVIHSSLVVVIAATVLPNPNESFAQMIPGQIRGRIYMQLVIYAGVAGFGHAFAMYGRWAEQAEQSARLEAQLADSRLSALRAQLHPHLLFNSLHAVASLVRESRNPEAVRLIADLSELLRKVLDTDRVWHTVANEVALVRTFFDIQRVRFEDRLVTSIDVASDAADGVVPVLVIQPLVENSLRHGLAGKVGVGHVDVSVHRDGGDLLITVADDGVGPAAGGQDGGGTGLSNLRARLDTLYGVRATMTAGGRETGGFLVTIRLPFRPS